LKTTISGRRNPSRRVFVSSLVYDAVGMGTIRLRKMLNTDKPGPAK